LSSLRDPRSNSYLLHFQVLSIIYAPDGKMHGIMRMLECRENAFCTNGVFLQRTIAQVCQLLGHERVELFVRAQLTIFPQSSAIASARLFLPPAGRIEFTEERAACSREREREKERPQPRVLNFSNIHKRRLPRHFYEGLALQSRENGTSRSGLVSAHRRLLGK